MENSPPPFALKPSVPHDTDDFTLSRRDHRGTTCPFSAHVRKINPRDTVTERGRSQDTLARLIIRRGIPFGPTCPGELGNPVPEMSSSEEELKAQRGLIFLCYQTSIENQFVFLQRNWSNHPSNPNSGGGEDPLIGQGEDAHGRHRFVDIRGVQNTSETLNLPADWVIPTGGGFFFSPAISIIRDVLGRARPAIT